MKSHSVVALAFILSMLSSGPVLGQQAQGGARAWTADVQGFNVVLVLGEMKGQSGPTDDLPQGARRALVDMREFLPFKHYRVLDSQWTSCCSSGRPITLAGRLQGLGTPVGNGANLLHRSYSFNLTLQGHDRPQVDFVLQEDAEEPAATTTERRLADLKDQVATVKAKVAEAERKVEVGLLAPIDLRTLRDEQASLERHIAEYVNQATTRRPGGRSGRILISSSFSMSIGETVVVGTSRLGGDKALIALVTAAKRSVGRDSVRDEPVSAEAERQEAIAGMQRAIAIYETRREQLRQQGFTSGHPEVRQINAEIKHLQQELAAALREPDQREAMSAIPR